MHKRLIILLTFTLLWAPLCRASLFQVTATDLASETRLAAQERKQLAVLFEQEGCEACAKLKKTVFSDRNAERLFSRRYRTVSVDLASDGDITAPDGKMLSIKAWAEQLRVIGTPALVFFDKDGRPLYRHVGPVRDSGEFVLLGRYVASGESENLPFLAYTAAQQRNRRAAPVARPEICHSRN